MRTPKPPLALGPTVEPWSVATALAAKRWPAVCGGCPRGSALTMGPTQDYQSACQRLAAEFAEWDHAPPAVCVCGARAVRAVVVCVCGAVSCWPRYRTVYATMV